MKRSQIARFLFWGTLRGSGSVLWALVALTYQSNWDAVRRMHEKGLVK